jgi:hypothetical protein
MDSFPERDGETPLSVRLNGGTRRLGLKGFDSDGILADSRKGDV